jgi:hypothetical protein
MRRKRIKSYGAPTATAIHLFEEEVMEKSILLPIRTLEYGSVQTAKVTKRRIANWQVESPAVARNAIMQRRSIALKFASISCGHHPSGVIKEANL